MINRQALDTRLAVLSALMQTTLTLDKSQQGYRVECCDGSKMLSLRGTSRETMTWIEAGITVLTNLRRGAR